MSWRGTALLFALLGVLGAAIWWSDHRTRRATGTAEAPLLAHPETLTVLEVRTGGHVHRFERHDGAWLHSATAATPAAVETLVDALATLAPIMVVSDGPNDPAEFGLGSDAVRIVAWRDDTPTLDLQVGARNPAWTAVYVRRADTSRVEMVGALLHWELSKLLDRPIGP